MSTGFCYNIFLPGEDRKLRLDDLNPYDDKQQGADDEDNELQQCLQDSTRESIFTLQDLPQSVQQHGQCELQVIKDETRKEKKE